MSLTDSVFVAVQSLLSSGFGLSLGIEGGFTQTQRVRSARRLAGPLKGDATMCACSSVRARPAVSQVRSVPHSPAPPTASSSLSAAIPLRRWRPVVAASVAGTLTARAFTGHTYHLPLGTLDVSQDGHALTAVLLGVLCGLLSVALMRGVTVTETSFHNSGLRITLRPVAGGILVGIIATFVPHVLGSGHQAMALLLHGAWPLGLLAAVLAAKIAASALSIGAGFRGGLFSTSLFLGAVTGALAGQIGLSFGFLAPGDVALMSLVGMASFGAAVVGAPMTMALLAVEVTGELSVSRSGAVRCRRGRPDRAPSIWLFVRHVALSSAGAKPSWAVKMSAGPVKRSQVT